MISLHCLNPTSLHPSVRVAHSCLTSTALYHIICNKQAPSAVDLGASAQVEEDVIFYFSDREAITDEIN